jgi:hypothetical protein
LPHRYADAVINALKKTAPFRSYSIAKKTLSTITAILLCSAIRDETPRQALYSISRYWRFLLISMNFVGCGVFGVGGLGGR